MKILTSGCSFTQCPEYPGGPNLCWPRQLAELEPTWTINNLGEAGAGNQYICDGVIRHILTNPRIQYDCVAVMWSGVSRLDYLTGLEDPAWEKLFDSYGFYRRLPGNQLGYIFSGGEMGTWFKNQVAETMFREMYKVSTPLSLATINVMEMIKLRGFLESRHIKYKFMSYINYWGTENNLSRNGDFGIGQFPDIVQLLQDMDWSRWIFTNDQRDGIYEMAVTNKDLQADQFHPAVATQKAWAELVRKSLD